MISAKNRAFKKNSVLQLCSAICNIVSLSVFVLVLPKYAPNASEWLADYFLALAYLMPIFVFFSYELRKLTACGDTEYLGIFNSQRIRGLYYSVGVSLLAIGALVAFGFVRDPLLLVSLLFYKFETTLSDQVSANFENQQRFDRVVVSDLLKTTVFLVGIFGSCLSGFAEFGIIIAVSLRCIVMVSLDLRWNGFSFKWFSHTVAADRALMFAGLGSFLISLIGSVPRVLASFYFGDVGVNVIGIGQTLNRAGQILSASMSQALIATRSGRNTGMFHRITLITCAQLFIACFNIVFIPFWLKIFSIETSNEGINELVLCLVLLIIFGFVSQVNYTMQTLLLYMKKMSSFLYSPIIFLGFFILLDALFLLFYAERSLLLLVTAMVLSRVVQGIWNVIKVVRFQRLEAL